MTKLISVTDHAVIRYLERAHDFDTGRIRAHIERVVSRGVALGASGVIFEGVKFVLVGDRVVTCVPLHKPSIDRRLRPEGQ
ncbi:hypothetical protein P7F60_06345 [Rhizobium sp. YJ-22]|uniref:hypothetical protein n=1 Tax=Rhizobium sp. YJ-22 TaxID=3037556 RepID=UPI00241293DF|nr:hypothetical protein [Rhizobium sp. YJ-22]MDG3575996.1 hypothetical protein [Rhizobium sp. YJ-22]